MKKIFIQNRKEEKLAVVVELLPKATGLAFVMHGLGGFKEQAVIRTASEAFFKANFNVVTFDAANTVGESGGTIEKASLTNYYEDLEDVIAWSRTQPWYSEPFILSGHSLGGISTGLYAERFPQKVRALVLMSAVISGKLSQIMHSKDELEEWQKTGWLLKESISRPGLVKRVPWHEFEDRQRYDLLPNVGNLTMPVLLIVGENDRSTPLEHQRLFYDRLSCPKSLEVIKDAPHTFRDVDHLKTINSKIAQWLRKCDLL
jgi:pimeloyl-ACP methyl ester carboxylesterase